MRHEYRVFELEHLKHLFIYSVWYDDDGNAVRTKKPVLPNAISLESLRRDLEEFLEALEKPILQLSDVSDADCF